MDNEMKETFSISNLQRPHRLETHRTFVRHSRTNKRHVFPSLRSLVVRGESQRGVAAVEDDELRLEHDVTVDLQGLARVRLNTPEAS